MIKYSEFNKYCDDIYDQESVILDRYCYFDNGERYGINNCLLNSFEVFQKVCDLGKDIFNKYLEINNLTIKDIYKKRFGMGHILKLYNNGTYTEIINNWINENGYPYSSKVKENEQKMLIVEDAFKCYIFSQIHKKLVFLNEEGFEYSNPDRKQNPKYSMEFYIRLIRIILTNEIPKLLRGSEFNDGVLSVLLDEENDYTDIRNKLNKIIKSNDTYTEQIDDNTVFFIRAALISHVLRKVNDTNSSNREYMITKTVPVYNTKTKEFRFYEKATSLIGIAYYRMLLILSTTKYGYTRIPCRNEECNNYFIRSGKKQFCETCMADGTARKIIYREYNKKRKKQTTSSPQTT